MNQDVARKRRKRSGFRLFVLILVRTVRAFSGYFFGWLRDDARLAWSHARLFSGIALLSIGMLSFSTDKHCDGASPASYYACTRPSTYYYYSVWSILCVLLGAFLITLWYLRKNKT